MWTSQPHMMLVDMNSFFASVEQQANPKLRGRAVGVSPSGGPGSCLIGTSKEAKAMGIRNGIPLYKARRICPDIVVVESEPEKYREVSRSVKKIFQDYTDQLEVYSIDEAFLDLQESKKNPMMVGAEIKRRIREEVGEWLTCSVGIGQNRFLCKLAAELEKPDGLSIVWRENLTEIYRHKKFPDLWGINRGWTNRLAKIGILTPLQLLNYPVQNLIELFGKPGYYIWRRVNGLEDDQMWYNSFHSSDDPKSFGHSWVLNFRTPDKQLLAPVVLRLAEKAARRMRREGFEASGIYISIRLADGQIFHRSKRLKFYIQTGTELYHEAMKIWENWQFNSPVMHIAVGFSGLQIKSNQLSLFGNKTTELIPTLDYINNKYGEFAIRSGLLTHTQSFAPDAIAFGK